MKKGAIFKVIFFLESVKLYKLSWSLEAAVCGPPFEKHGCRMHRGYRFVYCDEDLLVYIINNFLSRATNIGVSYDEI
jgi:hypothetical protein